MERNELMSVVDPKRFFAAKVTVRNPDLELKSRDGTKKGARVNSTERQAEGERGARLLIPVLPVKEPLSKNGLVA